MKKIICCLLLFAILGSLLACGNKSKYDKDNTEVIKDIIELADKYYDAEIDREKAEETFERFSKRIDYDTIDKIEGGILEAQLSIISNAFSYHGDDDTLLEYRNELAESIGIPKR